MRTVRLVATALLLFGGAVLPLVARQGSAAAPQRKDTTALRKESPPACDRDALTAGDRKKHFEELGPELRSLRRGVRELPDGYEFEYPSDGATYRLLTEWAAGERVCCPFFDIDVQSRPEGGPLLLRLTGREGVKKFIEADAAARVRK